MDQKAAMKDLITPLVLNDSADGVVRIGDTLSGFRTGPTLLVSCTGDLAHGLMAAIAAIPRIGDLRGSIAIIDIDQLENLGTGADHRLKALIGPIDATLFLPFRGDSNCQFDDKTRREMVWSILAKATQLGMISGRGIVPNRIMTVGGAT
jgi:hypothetical protein